MRKILPNTRRGAYVFVTQVHRQLLPLSGCRQHRIFRPSFEAVRATDKPLHHQWYIVFFRYVQYFVYTIYNDFTWFKCFYLDLFVCFVCLGGVCTQTQLFFECRHDWRSCESWPQTCKRGKACKVHPWAWPKCLNHNTSSHIAENQQSKSSQWHPSCWIGHVWS